VANGSPVTRPSGTAVHYSRRLELARHPALLPPRTRVEDSVLDLIGTMTSLDEAVSLISRAVGRRRTTAPLILAALASRPRMRWRADIIRVLGIAAEGAHSLLEYRYVTRVERPHRLPRGARQRRVSQGGSRQYQDVSYDGYMLVVELDGLAGPPSGSTVAGCASRQHQHRLWPGHASARLRGRFGTKLRIGSHRGTSSAAPGLARDDSPVPTHLPGAELIIGSDYCPYKGSDPNQ
jgi:hypothetical protein